MANKVVHRQFVKHTSVFKNWNEESKQKRKDSIESDCKLWKLRKFIKEDEKEVIELYHF